LYRPPRGRDTSARIATGYGLDDLCSISVSRNIFFVPADCPDRV
jgi:hypothetical protein